MIDTGAGEASSNALQLWSSGTGVSAPHKQRRSAQEEEAQYATAEARSNWP
jgi:hypothetical protein